jgi:hypothetical protein
MSIPKTALYIRKKQDDRLLKQLTRMERRNQERLRQLILSDPVFKTV